MRIVALFVVSLALAIFENPAFAQREDPPEPEKQNAFICTVSLLQKAALAGKGVISQSSYSTPSLAGGTTGVLKEISESRVLVYRGKIRMSERLFTMQVDEVDRVNGVVNFGNPKNIVRKDIYYSKQPRDHAANEPATIETSYGKVLVSCTDF